MKIKRPLFIILAFLGCAESQVGADSVLMRTVVICGAAACGSFLTWRFVAKPKFCAIYARAERLTHVLDLVQSAYDIVRTEHNQVVVGLQGQIECVQKSAQEKASRFEHVISSLRTQVAKLQQKLKFVQQELRVSREQLNNTRNQLERTHNNYVECMQNATSTQEALSQCRDLIQTKQQRLCLLEKIISIKNEEIEALCSDLNWCYNVGKELGFIE